MNSLDSFANARSTAVNTFTTLRDVTGGSLPTSYGNELRLGTKVQLEACGEYSTTGTPTMRLGFGYGVTTGGAASTGVTLAVSDLVATVSAAAAFAWHMNWMGTVTAVGATGVIYGSGVLELASTLILMATKPIPITAALRSVTIDTTLQKTWDVIAEFGTSSASNQVIVDYFNVKIENQAKTS